MVVVLTAAGPLGLAACRPSSRVNHFDAMAKIVLLASIIMSLSYATEWFMAWYGGAPAERSLVVVPVHRRLRAALLDHARSATA